MQMVAQVFNLCKRSLKPAAANNHLMIATRIKRSFLTPLSPQPGEGQGEGWGIEKNY